MMVSQWASRGGHRPPTHLLTVPHKPRLHESKSAFLATVRSSHSKFCPSVSHGLFSCLTYRPLSLYNRVELAGRLRCVARRYGGLFITQFLGGAGPSSL